MKPRLVLGLGNELAGDDGIGVRVVERLAAHPGLPDGIEVRVGGADLLRSQDALHGREQVILVDAVLGSETPGTVVPLDPGDPRLVDQGGAHQLSPTAALALLRVVDPALRDLPVTLAGVVIDRAEVADSLSPELSREVDTIVERVLELIEEARAPDPGR